MNWSAAVKAMKFRKKPVVINAVQFTAVNFNEIEEFVGRDAWFRKGKPFDYLATLEGPLRVDPGDWIIKDVKGKFYTCKPDIFTATYDPT